MDDDIISIANLIAAGKTVLECPKCEKEFECNDAKDTADEICPFCGFNYMDNNGFYEDEP